MPFIKRNADSIFLGIGILLAVLLRYILLPHQSFDFSHDFGPWYDFIQENGGLYSLRYHFANYTPPYLYLLFIVGELFPWLVSVYAVKLVSIAFDFIAAFFVYKLVRLRYPTGAAPLFACLVTLLAPTVVLNSAFWGQSDIIYTTGLLACIYFLATKRNLLAMIAFGLAISFKLQAAFLLPLIAVLVVTGLLSWKKILIIPLVYLITILPAWLVGRPINELLLIYLEQSTTYVQLQMNAPNLYQWLLNDLYYLFYPVGMILTAAVALIYVWMASKRQDLSPPSVLVSLALISVFFMPFFLPKMHERYFFAADVFSIAFAFYYPGYFFLPILVGAGSFFSYTPFLFGNEVIPLRFLGILNLIALAILFKHMIALINFMNKPEYRDSNGHWSND
jgi:Gpi18-like mannosyltransferase